MEAAIAAIPETATRTTSTTETAAVAATGSQEAARASSRSDADPRALRKPSVFASKTREEEATSWLDWKRVFVNSMVGHHAEFMEELAGVANDREHSFALADMPEPTRRRSHLLYGHLAVYVVGRLGRIVQEQEAERNGFRSWQRLLNEMEPIVRTARWFRSRS